MKVTFLILLFLSVCFSVNNQHNENLVGSYQSPKNTFFNKVKYGDFAVNLKLELNKDNTYTYSTCSQITRGKWKFSQNKLSLICQSRKFLIDSLNNIEKYNKGRICTEDEIFLVEKNTLIQEITIKNKSFKILLLK